jgi:hypothetical protein
MNNSLLQVKIKERLNKLASLDYDNIECWQIMEAFNKAQLEWFRRQIHGANLFKEGDESSKMNIDDVQKLLTNKVLTFTDKPLFYQTEDLPQDYLYFKRISVNATSECCPQKRQMVVYLAPVADVDNLLVDKFRKPSAEWGETFCTLQNNYINIYTNGDFELEDPVLHYYRRPQQVQFLNCVDPSSGALITTDVSCEFKDDIVEILIDETCAILAGDIESMIQIERNKQNSNNNT